MKIADLNMGLYSEGNPTEIYVELNISENAKNHYTHDYSITHCSSVSRSLVVRRGQPFVVTFTLRKEFDCKQDDLNLVFVAGKTPTPAKGTRISLFLPGNFQFWDASIIKNEQKKLQVNIYTPPTCYVGKWKLQIKLMKKSESKDVIFDYTHNEDIYILFNPWCKDDQVYMPDSSLLKEYILHDTGKIYMGNKKQIFSKTWNFGQFEEDILDCAMDLLDTADLSWAVRGDPVKVSRKLTSLVNCGNIKGVLVGKWAGDFSDGTPPTKWAGSVCILKEYYKTKSAVRYGQCWVFSGVLTTIFRTLGIPARSVTNFESAHDSDGSITIDFYWSEHLKRIQNGKQDSIWNFHVWNDVWMGRPDLPQGYGGWQAVDGTPQEVSDGTYQCGPASLVAIKRGQVFFQYDTHFVFAEVNADKINWQVHKSDDMTIINIDKTCIGNSISTKQTKHTIQEEDGMEREDITDQYKYKEGSEEERIAVITANQNSTKKGIYFKRKESDVDFELMHIEKVHYGDNFKVIMCITNKSDEERNITGSVCVSSMYYTGILSEQVISFGIRKRVRAKSSEETDVPVSFEDYKNKLVDLFDMNISSMCKVKETKHTYVAENTFRFKKPHLTIAAQRESSVGNEMEANVFFHNPLSCSLTNCELTVEGPGLTETSHIPQKDVDGNGIFNTKIQFRPFKVGWKELIVAFDSTELKLVNGSCKIKINEA